jgi:zinc protease
MTVRYRLSNGLTVVFQEHHTAKVVAFQAWVNAGSADERSDQAGLAHLHEHMLFKGTARRGPGEIARDIEAHGGEINAWTSFDQTVYHLVLASQFAVDGIDILADAIRNSAFDRDELSREMEVVCEEIKRSDDLPARRASRDLFATAYRVHPYGRPVIGWEQTVRSFTREKVLEFYEQYYAPENVVVAVAGDLAEGQLRDWVEAAFGGRWGRPFQGRPARPREPKPTGRRIFVAETDTKEVHLQLAFQISSVEHPDAPALDALAMLLGQGESSRLVMEVKRRKALVNDIRAYAYTPKDPGLLAVGLTAPAQKVPEALVQGVAQIAELTSVPVDPEELATVQALIESEAVYQRETVQGVARKLGFYESAAGGIQKEAQYYERIASLTPQTILEVAQKYLRLDEAILTGLFPPGGSLPPDSMEESVEEGRRARFPTRTPLPRRPDAPPQARGSGPLFGRGEASGVVIEKLPSGATIILRQERSVPLFAVRAAFLGGLRYETDDTSGLTTLLARMMTRGTRNHTAEEISHLLDAYAGSMAGQGGRNSLSLRGEFLSRHFDQAFALFLDCLLNSTLPETEFARERALLLQDILTREDQPSGVAFDLFARTLYRKHPYRLPLLGEHAAVARLTPEALRRYQAEFMNPSQMTLSIVGDIHPERLIGLVREAFSVPGGAAASPLVAPEPGFEQSREARSSLNRAQSHLILGFLGARVTDPWRYALEVLSTVLSGQGGRLFSELRDKRSMAYSVSSFSVEGVDPGSFGVYIGTSPQKLDAAADAIRVELSAVREERISSLELDRAKQNLIGAHEIGLQRNSARAALLALDSCYGVGLENFARYAERIATVGADEVRDVAQRIVDFNRSALVVVGP